jgi:hypothetical protein
VIAAREARFDDMCVFPVFPVLTKTLVAVSSFMAVGCINLQIHFDTLQFG